MSSTTFKLEEIELKSKKYPKPTGHRILIKVLDVANNMIKHYGGPEFIDIEIVAFGPGISLLYSDNPNAERISSLQANEVRFVVCMNTVETIARSIGKKPDIIKSAIPVQTGVAHIIERAKQGFIIVRP